MSYIVLDGIVKRFGHVTALNGVSLEIRQGEFFTLLGPSGCGKSTLLRIVAGFYRQDAGNLYIGGRLYNDIPPHKRQTGMVFQNYAIFPHMSVFDNIAYGLRAQGAPKTEIHERVTRALAMVRLSGYGERRPDQLSGGQKQRVALARAVVIEPKVLLMDEPLSNLDAKLRQLMRRDIRKLQQDLGITTIYVTHDQEEALAVSDRIAVMDNGEIRQLSGPADIYRNPSHSFVADFIGTTNSLRGRLAERRRGEEGRIALDGAVQLAARVRAGDVGAEVIVSVRPEHIRLRAAGASAPEAAETANGYVAIPGQVLLVSFLGSRSMVEVRVPMADEPLQVETETTDEVMALAPGSEVSVEFEPRHCMLFDAQTGRRLDA